MCRFLIAVCCASFVGCSGGIDDQPDLGEVTGTVKLGGQALKGARVTFQPEKGRPSTAITNDDGQFTMMYKPDLPGAKVGKHKVRISTFDEGDPDSGRAAREEEVPAMYNVHTELEREVKPSNEPFVFELESGGEIIPPDQDEGEGKSPRYRGC